MLLAIDIGNSLTKFGIFESASLIDKFSIPTETDYSVNELLFDRLRYVRERFFSIHTIIASSVVPEVDNTFRKALKELLDVTPVFVDHSFDFGFRINYKPVTSLGIDRLINAAAAASKYSLPAIACSFGTATTVDAVGSDAVFLGGSISPGLKTLAEALNLKTSKLPLVSVEKPECVFGKTTEDSIKSGVFFGHIGTVEGILQRMFAALGETPKVVATGGFAAVIAANSKMIDVVDENLTLDGLRLLADRRRG